MVRMKGQVWGIRSSGSLMRKTYGTLQEQI